MSFCGRVWQRFAGQLLLAEHTPPCYQLERQLTSPVVQMRSAYDFLGSLMQLVVIRMGPVVAGGVKE